MPLGLLSPIFPVQDKKLSGCLQVFFGEINCRKILEYWTSAAL